MDSHQIREENARIRVYMTQYEDKMRQLAEALETRNEQIKTWSSRYEELRLEYVKLGETVQLQENSIRERDEEIARLQEQNQRIMEENQKQVYINKTNVDSLRSDLQMQRDHFIKTLNELNHSKEPANEAFKQFEFLLQKRDTENKDLQEAVEAAEKRAKGAEEEISELEDIILGLRKDIDQQKKKIADLTDELKEAKSGRIHMDEINSLMAEIEVSKRKQKALQHKAHKIKKENERLRELIEQKENVIAQYDKNLEIANDKLYSEQSLRQKIIHDKDNLMKLLANERQANKEVKDQLQKAAQNKADVEAELNVLKNHINETQNRIEKDALIRVKAIKNVDQDKNKIRELQLRVRQEMERRLDAEEKVYDLKEASESLKKEIAVLREQLADTQGVDTSPLIELLKDLRVECVAIDKDLEDLINNVPEIKDLSIIEIPPGICESAATQIARAGSIATEYQIENRQLRTVISRLARTASTYHRVASVIAKYPILTAEDIGTEVDRGNWVLPVETEHLQRTIIKLHEILTRKKNL